MSKNNISVIIPVHELDETTTKLFSNAVKSVELQKSLPVELMIVVPKDSEVSKYMKEFDFSILKDIVTIVENEGNTDFSSQFNLGVEKAKGEWVSLLEYDDEYANTWFRNFEIYQEAYPNVELFLPIIIDVDETNSFISFTNEAVWANSFSDELGVLDNNALLAYPNFNIDGMIIKKSLFSDFGGFKSSIKLTFIYEFLLRMTFKDVKTMVIPKFSYKHVTQRQGSLFNTYHNTMDQIEVNWWKSVAKKEYYFPKDRNITYNPQTT